MLARWASFAKVFRRGGCLVTAIAGCALATAGSPHAVEIKACTDAQSSATALRECTMLLQSPDLSDQNRIGLYLRRGQAWLVEEEPAETVAENYLFVVKNNTRSAGPYRKALQRLGVDTPP